MQADEDKNKMYEISITENTQVSFEQPSRLYVNYASKNKDIQSEEVMLQIEKLKDEPYYSSEDVSDDDGTSEGFEVPLITTAGGCLPQNLSKEAEDKVVRSTCQNENYACKSEEEVLAPIEEVMLEIDVIKDEPCSSPEVSDDEHANPGVEVPLITLADGSVPQYKVATQQPHKEVLEKKTNTNKNRKELNKTETKHKLSNNNANEIEKQKKVSSVSEDYFSCDMCAYKSQWRSSLSRHLRTHTGEKSSISEDRFFCDMCSYKSKWRSSLKRHQRTHTDEKPYSCNFCSYKCKQKSHLIQHLRTHTGERPFCCNICLFKFNHKSNFKQHIKKHTGEKKHISCDICSFQCYQAGDLKRHMRTHTGEKPYSCSVCSYKCSQQGHLKQHERKHK